MKKLTMLSLALMLVATILTGTARSHGEHIASDIEGTFSTTCFPSHFAYDDPIVFPGQPGASHLHEFFGNTSTNAFSTYASMTAAPSNCNFRPDTAGYWVPTLHRPDGTVVPAYNHWIYVRDFGCTTLAYCNWGQELRPFPPNLKIVTGGANSPMNVAHWTCTGVNMPSKTIPDCPLGSYLTFEVGFPQCWDGVNLDSPDHRSHMTYELFTGPDGKRYCPASHPVRLPALSVFGLWVNSNYFGSLGYRLSSDATTQHGETLHADFWNTWNQAELEGRITQICLIDHGDIPESPNDVPNHDPGCLQADSLFAPAPSPFPSPSPSSSPSPPPSPSLSPSPSPTVSGSASLSPSPSPSRFCQRRPNHWKCRVTGR